MPSTKIVRYLSIGSAIMAKFTQSRTHCTDIPPTPKKLLSYIMLSASRSPHMTHIPHFRVFIGLLMR